MAFATQAPARRDRLGFEDFDAVGAVAPWRVMARAEAGALLAKLDAVRPADAAAVPHPWFYKSHLLFRWMDALVRLPAMLDAVERLIGPDILAMSADIWRKQAGETRHVSMHQDASYWSLEPLDIVTAWVALTEANPANGGLRFALGSHRLRRVGHTETFAPDNMLSHGQTARIDPDRFEAFDAVLAPGEISLHHALLAHGSGPNGTGRDRVGVCIRYLPGRIRVTGGPPVSAMPVRGRHSGNLALERPPEADLSAGAIRRHTQAMAPHAHRRYVTF